MINLPEFKSFSKIPRFEGLQVIITQKIHGTNAQVYIEKVGNTLTVGDNWFYNNKAYKIYAGSRTRWLTPEDDNYGFAKWVNQNAQTLIEFLGEGRHYGEWAGPGINSGEGLKQKTFVLFEPWRYNKDLTWPEDIKFVPTLLADRIILSHITHLIVNALDDLKENGSKLVPGYMFPEGIVITINGQRFKKTFDKEDVAWERKKERVAREHVDYSYLCQPLRLEKLLSRDEKYLREYPKSLPEIVKTYLLDLKEEDSLDDEEFIGLSKNASRQIFGFVKEHINEKTKI